jgi:hypothetical protein
MLVLICEKLINKHKESEKITFVWYSKKVISHICEVINYTCNFSCHNVWCVVSSDGVLRNTENIKELLGKVGIPTYLLITRGHNHCF